jgi:excisionase family DNA binding protein
MNNGEKTVVNPFFTENCTKQQYESELAGLILICMAAGFSLPESEGENMTAVGKLTPQKIRQDLSLFQNRGKVFLYIRRRFFCFFAKPTRMGSTVCGDGQLFFIYTGGHMESYWKVSEVAAAIQVSEQTVYRYVATGEIPCHKLSRAVRFKPSEIESWMEGRKAEAAKHEL